MNDECEFVSSTAEKRREKCPSCQNIVNSLGQMWDFNLLLLSNKKKEPQMMAVFCPETHQVKTRFYKKKLTNK
jgi:hypothetical protein